MEEANGDAAAWAGPPYTHSIETIADCVGAASKTPALIQPDTIFAVARNTRAAAAGSSGAAALGCEGTSSAAAGNRDRSVRSRNADGVCKVHAAAAATVWGLPAAL